MGSDPTDIKEAFVMVPREPTDKMASAGETALMCGPRQADLDSSPGATWAVAKTCWREMYDAAPVHRGQTPVAWRIRVGELWWNYFDTMTDGKATQLRERGFEVVSLYASPSTAAPISAERDATIESLVKALEPLLEFEPTRSDFSPTEKGDWQFKEAADAFARARAEITKLRGGS